MQWKVIFLLLGGLIINQAAADECYLARGKPATLTIPEDIITIAADAPASTTKNIGTFTSNTTGEAIGYNNCMLGTLTGGSLYHLNIPVADNIYQTNIPGIGVKIQYTASGGAINYTHRKTMTWDNDAESTTWDWPANSGYRLRFYKVAEKLDLKNPEGDMVLNAGEVAYEWVVSPASYTMRLLTGNIKIISTPVCTTDTTKTVDFGTVTPAMLKNAAIEKPLEFQVTCKTDYGSYSVAASITTNTPSSDFKYIKVTDAGGKTDQLGIGIYNSSKELMLMNGTTLEKPLNKSSNEPVKFNWTAKLFNTGAGNTRTQNGKFTAQAEIVLQIN